jgi:energy-converting hydrogenase Eha subunit A
MFMKKPEPKIGIRAYLIYLLVGAALGLYYGLFYKHPGTPPAYLMAVVLALVAGVVTIAVQFWKKKAPFREMLKDFLRVFVIFAVFLVGLELRKVIFEEFGKTVVTIYTTTLGLVLGLIVAYQRHSVEKIGKR